MGKVIHTKDGRTLMKGPDGRWMSAGKTAEKTVKLKNISDTVNMIDKYGLKSAKFNKDEDSYTVSQSDYDKMYKAAKNKKYIENLKHGGGQMYTHGYLPNPTKKIDTTNITSAKNIADLHTKLQERGLTMDPVHADAIKRGDRKSLYDGEKVSLHDKDGNEYRGTFNKYFDGGTEIVDIKKTESKKATEQKVIKDATKLAKLKSQYKLSDEAVKELMSGHNNNVDSVERSLTSAKKIADKYSGTKSLSFEKHEGYGLNPAEYKLSNGDGISPKSLNPNEGNPTNIKQLKDIPGRTSRHTDEIIVKSNYSGKEYTVTREHYKDTKTGYHRAEVVDIRRHVANKEQAPAKKSVPKNQIEVSDSHYIYSSGRKPSGNGNWAFYIGDSEEPVFFNGKYSEAKKKAIAEAAKRGVKKVILGS